MPHSAGFVDKRTTRRLNAHSNQMIKENASTNRGIVPTKPKSPITVAMSTVEGEDIFGLIATVIAVHPHETGEPLYMMKKKARVETQMPSAKQKP